MGVRGLQQPAPCVQENLRLWGREDHKREMNQAVGLALEEKGKYHKQGNRRPALKTAGCASRDKTVYWCCSLSTFGPQLIYY